MGVSIQSFLKAHINVVIKMRELCGSLRGFIGIRDHLRYQSWLLLRRLGECDDLPWLVGKDFNEILLS